MMKLDATRLKIGRHSASDCLIAIVAVATCLVAAEPAQAYLDPATGSMIIQAVVGTVLGAVLVVKVYWVRLKSYFAGGDPAVAKPARSQNDSK